MNSMELGAIGELVSEVAVVESGVYGSHWPWFAPHVRWGDSPTPVF